MSAQRATSRRGASKGNARKSSSGKPKVPGWLFLVTGFALGFFVASLINLTPSAIDVPVPQRPDGKASEQGSEPNPVFDFYTLLPESEVVLPEPEVTPLTRSAPQPAAQGKPATTTRTPAPKPAEHNRYLLQAGSFRSEKDAERLRANLILSGLTPRISKVNVAGGETWHRVQIGPFDDQGSLDNARRILAEQKIDSLLLKLK
ncbi:SPOR domain-containing protein [Endozoicomonas lisbonensis]|uniref:Cell division protein FtsN n=1 Tax=Endozoicomonas lisbonensis TaxID=3120522 RepID=A0ABV2SGR0_9GAMM